MTTESAVFQQKIQNLIDTEDIKRLMASYCHGIDKKDEALFMGIWSEDSVYELPRGEAAGVEGIRQLVHKVWREVPKCHHHITNPLIDVTGDRACANTDVIYFRKTADGVLQLLSGTYRFDFIRTAGAWKISRLKYSSFETVSPIFKENIKG
ncbi:MAG: nuclear transport factor 2 family protein [Pseudomonadota bacterium]